MSCPAWQWKGRRQAAKRTGLRQRAAEDALAAAVEQPEGDADVALARMWEALSGELDAVKGETAALNAALGRWFERVSERGLVLPAFVATNDEDRPSRRSSHKFSRLVAGGGA